MSVQDHAKPISAVIHAAYSSLEIAHGASGWDTSFERSEQLARLEI